jgi:hypothetical protein
MNWLILVFRIRAVVLIIHVTAAMKIVTGETMNIIKVKRRRVAVVFAAQ